MGIIKGIEDVPKTEIRTTPEVLTPSNLSVGFGSSSNPSDRIVAKNKVEEYIESEYEYRKRNSIERQTVAEAIWTSPAFSSFVAYNNIKEKDQLGQAFLYFAELTEEYIQKQ